jgi:hypothetical protein
MMLHNTKDHGFRPSNLPNAGRGIGRQAEAVPHFVIPRKSHPAQVLLLAALIMVPLATATGESLQAVIDGRRVVRELPRFALYQNTSLRYAPPHRLAQIVEREYGRPRIVRCWLPLDDMWDYRDGSYHFNFQLGYDRYKDDHVKHKYDRELITPFDLYYYDHLAAFSAHSDAILLNIRRYEREVINGVITMAKWKEVVKNGIRHYKQRYGNLRYIEVLNEYHLPSFGGLNDDQYYDFYRAGYEIGNELNEELRPAVPLEVGGPNVTGAPLSPEDPRREAKPSNQGLRLYRFFQHYAKDPNPRKRLDFVSFHDYGLAGSPAVIERYESILKSWLRENGLRDDIPLFETEIGYSGPKPDPHLNQRQATGISTFFYWTRANKQHVLFPWVLYHEPARQRSLSAFTPELKMAPFGAALKMWAMQKQNEVAIEWRRQQHGFYALATADDTGMAIQAWNDSSEPASVELLLRALPRALAGEIWLREYRIDSRHSNCLLVPESTGGLEKIRETKLSRPPQNLSAALEPYSLVLWTIEPASLKKDARAAAFPLEGAKSSQEIGIRNPSRRKP